MTPWAFLPERGQWIPVNELNDLRVHRDARYAIVRFAELRFLPGFGDALTKASGVWTPEHAWPWPPEEVSKNILIHGVGTRIVRVVFWAHVRAAI